MLEIVCPPRPLSSSSPGVVCSSLSDWELSLSAEPYCDPLSAGSSAAAAEADCFFFGGMVKGDKNQVSDR